MAISKIHAQKIFEDILNNMVGSGLFEIPTDKIKSELAFNKRTSALGCCKYTKRNGEFVSYEISLSEYAMKDETCIRNTLAHEIIHTMPRCQNHGATFKVNAILCKRIGYDVSTRASIEESEACGILDAQKIKAKYEIKCPNCDKRWYRSRMCSLVKNPGRYICGDCRSPLTRVC